MGIGRSGASEWVRRLRGNLTNFDVLRVVSIGSKSGAYGGPFDTAVSQARVLAESGLSVAIYAPHLVGDEPENPSALATFVSPALKGRIGTTRFQLATSLRAVAALMRLVSSSQIVFISIAREATPIAALLLALIYRRQLILQPHGMLTSRTSVKHRLFDLFLRPFLGKNDLIIALTRDEADKLEQWLGRRAKSTQLIEIVGNPILWRASDIEKLRGVENSNGPLFLARLHPRKRVEDFIAAAQATEIVQSTGRWKVVGPDGGDLHRVLQAEKVVPNLHYGGALPGPQVAGEIARSSVFVMPSFAEPWGNALCTACNIGIPVVVTESAALANEVRNRGLGIVVPDRDPAAIRDAVIELSQGWDQRAAIARLKGSIMDQQHIEGRLRSLVEDVRSSEQGRRK